MSDKTTIRVFTPGTHAGKRYSPGPDGIELTVSASQAKALRDRGADKPPTGVTDTRWLDRCSSRVPSCASSSAMRRLRRDLGMPVARSAA